MAVIDKLRTRMRTIRSAFVATKRSDSKLVPLMIGVPLAVLVLLVGLSVLIGQPVFGSILAVFVALLTATVLFGRRATKAQFNAIRGSPGAAASIMQSMRGQWLVTPAVAFSRKQDLVHRVVGRCGVALVGEGAKARTNTLLRQEQRKVARVVGDTPVHVVSIGEAEGQVRIDKLRSHLMRLPRKLKKREVAAVNKRLLSLASGDLPIPKGPMPGGVKTPRPRNR